MTVRRESAATAVLKQTKPAEAKHGVAKASRKRSRKQVHSTTSYTRVFGTAQLYLANVEAAVVSFCLSEIYRKTFLCCQLFSDFASHSDSGGI